MTISSSSETNIRLTKVIYILQLLYFFFGITYVIAMVINYIYRPDVRGTWLESHFIWQARTFWFSLLWMLTGGILTIVLVGYGILFLNSVWIFYRAVRGILRLGKGQVMYSGTSTRL